ncbi:hypothetical protein [Pseudophaeobacter arcticus]|uniref:hypothetical protein n=1 Tax=Pseudophaeobacter arcticus TaxID=385492 RepID=UPI000483E215|nr:hypothetical protein [Pseudophaeobacter arcticus]
MTIRRILIIGSSLGALASSAFAAVEPLNCKAPVNAAQEECFCQDSNIPNLSDADKELCVAWIASGGVPAGGGAAVTNFAPLIAPVAGVLGAAAAAGAGGSTTGTTGTTSTTGTN